MKARRAKRSTSTRTRGASDLRAREQQLATTEILEVISSSPSSVQPVFDAIIRSAVRLGDAQVGTVFRLDGNAIHVGAHCNLNAEAEALFQRVFPQPLNEGTPYGRAMLRGAVVNVADLEHSAPSEASRQRGRVLGTRAVLAVPMLAKERVIGAIAIGRRAPGAFSESYVSLLKTFAAQAVIAVENVRLFNETKEALGRQTATAEILKVIAGSPSDVQPVFDAIVRSAAKLFSPCKAVIVMREGDRLRWKARAGPQEAPAELDELYNTLYPLPLDPERSVSARAIVERRTIYVPDTEAADVGEAARLIGRAAKHRSLMIVPLLREGDGIGAIGIQHPEPKYQLTDKQVDLLRTFADQAAIAIENVRLFNETAEALERQTATAEILKVIAASPSDVQPVFEAIIKSAARLARGCSVNLSRLVGDQLHLAAYTPVSPAADEILRNLYPIPITEVRPLTEAVQKKASFFVGDFEADPHVSPKAREVMRARGFRSTLYVPIVHGDVVHGVMHVSKVEPGPFPRQWIDLLETFADQAVIAIENVRLFNETKEALEQQTAISEILRVISASPTDVQPVFETIIRSAAALCNSTIGAIFRYDGELIHYVAGHNFDLGTRLEAIRTKYPARVDNSLVSGRVIQTLSVVRIDDAADDPEYDSGHASLGGWRRMMGVPMLKDGVPLGVIVVAWDEPGVTPDSQEQLLRTFADQAVIAIENVRLFREIQDKSRQLEIANHHKSEFLANMSHELRTPLNAIIGFTRIVMRRSKEQLESKQYENLEKIHSSGQNLLALINAILDLSKVEAGHVEVNPADVALGSVLEQCVRTVEPLVKTPAVRLLKEFDGELPLVYQDEEKLRQIVINLLSNAAKFTERGTVRVQAKLNGDCFAVAVADTGIGIPGDKLEHVFEEFAQADASSTRVYGGTGLGLTIARRLARLMGGDIAVQSAPGSGSTFTLTLPLRYEARV